MSKGCEVGLRSLDQRQLVRQQKMLSCCWQISLICPQVILNNTDISRKKKQAISGTFHSFISDRLSQTSYTVLWDCTHYAKGKENGVGSEWTVLLCPVTYALEQPTRLRSLKKKKKKKWSGRAPPGIHFLLRCSACRDERQHKDESKGAWKPYTEEPFQSLASSKWPLNPLHSALEEKVYEGAYKTLPFNAEMTGPSVTL